MIRDLNGRLSDMRVVRKQGDDVHCPRTSLLRETDEASDAVHQEFRVETNFGLKLPKPSPESNLPPPRNRVAGEPNHIGTTFTLQLEHRPVNA